MRFKKLTESILRSLKESDEAIVVQDKKTFEQLKEISVKSGKVKPVEVTLKFRIAQKDEKIKTLEGPEDVKSGGYIMTGTIGEQYAIAPDKFPKKYKDITFTNKEKTEGKATKIVDNKEYEYLDPQKPFKAKTWAGVIEGDKNSVLLQYGADDYGIIRKDLFKTLYK
jgi:hypothetical protein